jgi:hypothetical protein
MSILGVHFLCLQPVRNGYHLHYQARYVLAPKFWWAWSPLLNRLRAIQFHRERALKETGGGPEQQLEGPGPPCMAPAQNCARALFCRSLNSVYIGLYRLCELILVYTVNGFSKIFRPDACSSQQTQFVRTYIYHSDMFYFTVPNNPSEVVCAHGAGIMNGFRHVAIFRLRRRPKH